MMTCLHLPLLPVLMLAWRVLLVKRKLCLESLDIKYHHILRFWRFSCWWQVQSLKYWTLTKSGSMLSQDCNGQNKSPKPNRVSNDNQLFLPIKWPIYHSVEIHIGSMLAHQNQVQFTQIQVRFFAHKNVHTFC